MAKATVGQIVHIPLQVDNEWMCAPAIVTHIDGYDYARLTLFHPQWGAVPIMRAYPYNNESWSYHTLDEHDEWEERG